MLGDVPPYHILNHAGCKIGVVGLAEFDWIETLSKIDPKHIEYRDFVEVAKE